MGKVGVANTMRLLTLAVAYMAVALCSWAQYRTSDYRGPAPAAYPAPADSASPLPLPVLPTVPRNYGELLANELAYDLNTPVNMVTTADYDPATGCYVVRTKIGEIDIATPFMLTAEQYNNWQLRRSMQRYYRERNQALVENKEKQPFNILDMNFALGPLEKIFGPGGVSLRTQGTVR